MITTSRRTHSFLVVALLALIAVSQARAWDPPDGPKDRPDLAAPPTTPTTLLPKAHGYIIQNGISVLHNDGYWFAAQMLRQWQQELLNGVRYADVYLGDQVAALNLCFLFGAKCTAVYSRSWPLAADNHYFNPDTGRGLDPGALNEAAFWAEILPQAVTEYLTAGIAYLDIDIRPDLQNGYPSALQMFDEEYSNALSAYFSHSAPSCGSAADNRTHRVLCRDIRGRQGTALAMFYLGWASHLLQDLTVVHHTFDEGGKNHNGYEQTADRLVSSLAPIANGQQIGIYDKQLPVLACKAGSRTCFASYAAYVSHDRSVLNAAAKGDYSNVRSAIPFAQRLQAGLYAAFLTDLGLPPVHMSAVMAAL